jgi:hypothetical protein
MRWMSSEMGKHNDLVWDDLNLERRSVSRGSWKGLWG